jgi:hypothetical protein
MTASKGAECPDAPPLKLRGLVRKTALLNLGIVATALPIAALTGDPMAFVVALVVVALVSLVAWASTFAAFSFLSLARIFRAQAERRSLQAARRAEGRNGVADRWMDGPV